MCKEHRTGIYKNIKRKWIRFLFPQRNRILVPLTGLLFLMSLLIIKYCDFPLLLPERYFSFLICEPHTDKLWYNLGISYVAAYIFYIIQVYIPAYNAEKTALKDIHKRLSGLIRSIKRIRYLLFQMYELQEHGELELINSSFFFNERYLDSYKQSGDYTYKREMINGKYVRTGKGGCNTDAEFRSKLMEEKETYKKLLSHRSIDRIDRNLYELIVQLDMANYCDGIANVINLTGKLSEVSKVVAESNTDQIRESIKSIVQNEQEISFYEDENAFYLILQDGQVFRKIQKPDQYRGQNIPFHTNVKEDDGKLVQLIERIEQICDLDTDLTFKEMSSEEERRYKDRALTRKIEQIVNNK